MSQLPTQPDIFRAALTALDTARAGCSDARDWLASDWREDHGLTPAAGKARTKATTAICEAKAAIDAAKRAVYEAIEATPAGQARHHGDWYDESEGTDR